MLSTIISCGRSCSSPSSRSASAASPTCSTSSQQSSIVTRRAPRSRHACRLHRVDAHRHVPFPRRGGEDEVEVLWSHIRSKSRGPGCRRSVPSVRHGQGHCLRHQALAGALPLPRRREAGDRQQHRRTCAARHRGRPSQLAVRRLQRRRRACRCDLHRHPDLQGQLCRPQAYISDIIAKIADDWPASRWDDLMPWKWRAATDQNIAHAA